MDEEYGWTDEGYEQEQNADLKGSSVATGYAHFTIVSAEGKELTPVKIAGYNEKEEYVEEIIMCDSNIGEQ